MVTEGRSKALWKTACGGVVSLSELQLLLGNTKPLMVPPSYSWVGGLVRRHRKPQTQVSCLPSTMAFTISLPSPVPGISKGIQLASRSGDLDEASGKHCSVLPCKTDKYCCWCHPVRTGKWFSIIVPLIHSSVHLFLPFTEAYGPMPC